MKRTLDESVSPSKRFHADITCLFDLPDEIILMICRYLSIYDIFHCFYTPENRQHRLHCLIKDYYTKVNIDGMKSNEFLSLIKLFKNSLRPSSLKLVNSNVSLLCVQFFKLISKKELQSIMNNLIHLTLLDCCSSDIYCIDQYHQYLTKLESLHITIFDHTEYDDHESCRFDTRFDIHINRNLFQNRLPTLNQIHIQSPGGLSLHKSLLAHENLRHVSIYLRTIDDLYLLLDGLIRRM